MSQLVPCAVCGSDVHPADAVYPAPEGGPTHPGDCAARYHPD